MRQADIHQGDVLFWNDNNDWEMDKGYGHRVVVLNANVGHWYMGKDGQFHDHGSKVRNPYGTWTVQGVVVEVHDGVGRTRKDVAPIRQLRGTFDECTARVQAYRDAREKARLEEEARKQELLRERRAREARTEATVNRLLNLGAVRYADVHGAGSTIEIEPDLLDAILDALPSNWRYEK